MLNAWLMSVVLWAALLVVFGIGILPYLLLQAAVGIVLLEIVNYLEHYGMLRQKEHTGRYERARQPSWNSNNIATNVLLYHFAASQRPSREPHPPLSGPCATSMRRRYCRPATRA